MKVFEYLDNPLYVYVDSEEYKKLLENIRGNLKNKTILKLIDRDSTWGFGLKDNISSIFADPNYPKHPPNTVIPDYSCSMHAKFDVMIRSVGENVFKTNYFAWLDIGYFRNLVNTTDKHFKIHLPPCFDETKVAYNEISYPWKKTLSQIIENNEVWVGGGGFFAEENVMQKWAEDYMYFTEKFIQLGLISTDQQVIYAMRQPLIHKRLGKRRIAIQEYHIKYIEDN